MASVDGSCQFCGYCLLNRRGILRDFPYCKHHPMDRKFGPAPDYCRKEVNRRETARRPTPISAIVQPLVCSADGAKLHGSITTEDSGQINEPVLVLCFVDCLFLTIW